MDVDFPRGGVVKADVTKKKTGKRKWNNENVEQAEKNAKKFVKSKYDLVWTNRLNLKVLTNNLLALGCVKSCNESEIRLELIDGLSAVIPITAVSSGLLEHLKRLDVEKQREKVPKLEKMFVKGQMLVIKVTSLAKAKSDKRQNVVGTTDPQEVNANLHFNKLQIGQVVMGFIKSIEDKGYQMDMGSKTTFGFLPFTRCHVDATEAVVGQVMMCTVVESSVPEQRLIQLTTSEPSTLSSVPARDQLLPGVLMKGIVDKVVPGGLYAKFDDRLIGFISKSKLNERFESMNVIENGTEVTAIVTFQTPHANMIGFSCQNSLFNHSNFDDRTSIADLQIGQKCKGIVKSVGVKTGVYFEFENYESDVVAFVPAKELQCEDDPDKIKSTYIIGATHDLRITGISLMNHLLYATNKKERINQQVVSIDTATPGMLVKVVVQRTILSGIFVKAGDNLNGFIPDIHTADIPVIDIESKFTKGQVLKTRILYGDIDRHRIMLTAKKSLIKSQAPIVASYDLSLKGVVCEGTVVHIKSNGLLVAFYNNVKGWLNRSELESAGIVEDPELCFNVGQILRVQILSVDPARRRMTLAPSNLIPLDIKQKISPSTASGVVQAKVVEATSMGLNVVFGDDYNERAFIPSYHLSDSASDLDLFASTFKVGDVIKSCVVFSKGSVVTLSAKPSIVEAVNSKTTPESFDQLEVGRFVVGVVSRIHSELGYFVDLPGGILHALAPFSHADESENKLIVGQTVVGKIYQIDVERQRFRIAMRLTNALVDGTKLSINLMKKYFVERRKIIETAVGSKDKTLSSLVVEMTVGKIVKCLVTKVTSVGLVCTLQNDLKGVVTVEHLSKPLEDYKENDKVVAFVLYVDVKDVCLELSLLPDVLKKLKILSKKSTTVEDAKHVEAKDDQRLRSTVLLVKKDFVLVSLDMHASGTLAYMPARLHYNDVLEYGHYRTGDRPSVIVKEHYDGLIFVSNLKNEQTYGVKHEKDHQEETSLQKWVTTDVGKIYDGRVLRLDNLYVDIFIKQSQKARIHISELADTFVEGSTPLDGMKANHPLRVKVIGFIKCANGVRAAECTMKKSKMEANRNKKHILFYKQTYKKGEKVFVFIDHFKGETCHVEVTPEWKGAIPISQMSDDPKLVAIADLHFAHGQVYTAYVVSIQAQEKRLHLSLLPPKSRKQARKSSSFKTSSDVRSSNKRQRTNTESSVDSITSDPDCVSNAKRTKRSSMLEKLERLKVDAGFNWTPDRFSMKNLMEVGLEMNTNAKEEEVTIKNECNQSVDDAEDKPSSSSVDKTLSSDDDVEIEIETNKSVDETTKKHTKGKFERDKIEEQQLIQKELSLLDPERNLDTAEDFDRLLMGSPDSSLLWLRYMAMYLQTAEISKARAVAERALKTISLREENEKFNVWTAMLNMENAYGTKDSLTEIFERAKQVNEPLKVYRQLLKIFERSNKTKEADELLDEMVRKFKCEFDVWILAGEHFYSSQPTREDKSREIMQRSMKSLPEHQQVDLVSRFAQMEFKYADSERGRTLFENLLNEYPKRTDIWSVYIDMTCKHRNADEARVLFERVTSLKLAVHKLKSFYKKWSEFETRHGTDETRRQIEERSAKIFKNNNDEDKEKEEEYDDDDIDDES